MITYLFKSTIDGTIVGIQSVCLPLATAAAHAVFGNLAFTWEGVAK
jgi:hypothetical protein